MQPSPAPAPRPIRRRKTKIALGILALLVFCVVAFLFRPMASGPGPAPAEDRPLDVAVIGGGVMSVTLATYLQELEPNWRVAMFERLDNVAEESSNGWNNAGTGHSGFAELNYTPENPDGIIDTTKAVAIAEQFEVARQFWAHEVKTGRLGAPNGFINPTPHMSFVWGDENIDYLRRRQAALVKNPLFYGMEFTRDPARIRAAIMAAAPGATEVAGRREAIRLAIAEAGPGDIVLLAGKGHEQGQIVGDRVLPFDDVSVAREEAA